jgi:hypothetical protein
VHVQRVVFETPANMGRGMHRRHALLKLRDLQIDGLPRLVRRKKKSLQLLGYWNTTHNVNSLLHNLFFCVRLIAVL